MIPPESTQRKDVPIEAVHYKNPIKIYGLGDLYNLDAPKWLLPDYLPYQGIVTLYGAPGCGKSFLAQAWALCLATGTDWSGRAVEPGASLYLACEGIAGMPRRVHAWVTHNNLDIPEDRRNDVPFYYTTGFNDLRGPAATTDLIRAIEHDLANRGTKLSLVVLDTLSRTLGGADENSAGEMNTALDQLDRIREVTGATILVLHHTAKGKMHERGSSVLRGACDTMLFLQDNDSHRLLVVDKQRDWEEAEPLQLFMQPVGDSAVLTTQGPVDDALTPKERRMYQVVQELFDGAAVSYSRLCKATDESEATLQRTLKRLCTHGLLVRGAGKRGGYYPHEHAPEQPEEDNDQ